MPFYLLMPFLATILIVFGFMFNKRAMSQGVDAWTVTFVTNMWAALLFSLLLVRDDAWQPWSMFWQPVVIGGLYVLGYIFTFLALERGDVSVATPVFSVKVLSVAVLVTILGGETLSWLTWIAALLATFGIALVQSSTPNRKHRRVIFSIVFALLAAGTFSLFDVLVQMWTGPNGWGAGRLLPLAYWSAAALSFLFLPLMDLSKIKSRAQLTPLCIGTLMMALQAMCIVFTLAVYGDAARVNIVYALRGLWGVVLAWVFASAFKSEEAMMSSRVMTLRLTGATLVTIAVIVSLVPDAIQGYLPQWSTAEQADVSSTAD